MSVDEFADGRPLPLVPHGWSWTTLSELLSGIEAGKSFKCEERPPTGEEYGLVKVSAVTWGTYNEQESKTITQSGQVQERYRIKVGDLLFSRANTIELVGASVIVHEVRKNLLLSDKILRLQAPENLKHWINWFLRSRTGRLQIEALSTGNQDSMRNIGQERIGQIRVPIAPPNEVKRVISKIDELFSRIDEGERALERVSMLVERYRQSVLKAAVTGELTRAWRAAQGRASAAGGRKPEAAEKNKHTLESGEALLARILKARRADWEKAELQKMKAKGITLTNDEWKQSYAEPSPPEAADLPELPEGWAWASLPQLGEFGRGKSKHRPRNDPKLYGGSYPFLQTGRVRASGGRITEFDSTYNEAGLAQSKLWPRGTICITIAANIAESGTLQFAACFPDSVVGLVPSELVVGEYVEFFVRTARTSLDRYAPATAQKNINLEILEQVAVPLPPLDEQRAIFSKAQEELSKIADVERTLGQAAIQSSALRQTTLRSAFRGELVPQDGADEPASTLLQRIAAERATDTDAPKRGRKKETAR